MTQKQIIGLVVGVSALGLILLFVYQQFTTSSVNGDPMPLSVQQSQTTVSGQEKKMAEPETIDDISLSIQGESSLDLSALDDEESGEISEIEADSDSVTNLGTSYDENSL